MARFHQTVYEKAIQMQVDAAEAAFPPRDRPDGRRPRDKGLQEVGHVTVNGAIRIARRVYWSPPTGSQRPMDAWLGIEEARVSRGARELCTLAAMASSSFAKGTELLWRLGQLKVSDEPLRGTAETEGRRVQEAVEQGRLDPGWTGANCAVTPRGTKEIDLGCDGVMVPVITAGEKTKRRGRQRRRTKAKRASLVRRLFKGSEHPWTEFKIAGFYDPSGTHVFALGTSGNADQLGRLMRRTAGRLKLEEAEEHVAIVDGAKWIGQQLATRLPMVETQILDYYHLMEHVGEAAVACFGAGRPETQAWVEAASAAALEEGATGLLVKVHETKRTTRTPAKREALKKLEQYVVNHGTMLDYPRYRACGYAIGSGRTESLCGTLTTRVKGGRGKRWK